MTEAEIAAIEARADATTPEPWLCENGQGAIAALIAEVRRLRELVHAEYCSGEKSHRHWCFGEEDK